METDVDWHQLLQDCWHTKRSVSTQTTSAVRLVVNAVDRIPDTRGLMSTQASPP